MNIIIFKDNVYVAVPESNVKKDSADIEVVDFRKNLFGGRVKVRKPSYNDYDLYIDGISILSINFSRSNPYDTKLSTETTAAYLTQIQNLGVDTFLNNYKKSLETMKADLESLAKQLESSSSNSTDEKGSNAKLLRKIYDLLSLVICLIFTFSVNMNAGIDNHVYEEVYNSYVALTSE